MAQHPRRRLRNLKVASVDLVDDGDNPGARFVLFKRLRKWLTGDEDLEPDEPTDDERELFGKAFHLPGQATSAADCPPGWRFVPSRRMCVREASLSKQQPTASSVHVDTTGRDDEDERRRRRRRPRRDGAGSSHLAKLTVRTEEQESGGVSPHPHNVELPDGALSAGRFRTDEVQDHVHDLVLTQDLEPGQSVTVETGPAVPDPPAGVEQHTHAATITATEAMAARREDLEKQETKREDDQDFPARAFAFVPDRESPSLWKLRLFDRVADVAANRPSIVQTAQAAQALGTGFRGNRVQLPTDARPAVIRRVRAAWLRARSDRDVTREDLPNVLKASWFGRVTEAFYKWAGLDSPSEELEQLLEDELEDFTEPPAEASTNEEVVMDLSKLKTEDREKVEAALTEAGSVEVFAKNLGNLKVLLTKGAETAAELAKLKKAAKDEDEDPLEGVPEEIRKIVEPQLKAATDRTAAIEKENVTLKGRLDKLDRDAARVVFEKTIGDLTGLPQKRDDVIETLWSIDNVEKRAEIQKTLEAAAAAARRGAIYDEIGSGLTEGGGAYAKIEAAAAEIRKANPKLTEAESKAQAMDQNPELYDAVLEESAVN